MYEVAAPPAFLLTSKLDPIFAQSKQFLSTIGTPKTEAEQSIYNQVCCGPSGFGTHYVGSIIVGARATVTTFVNSSFHSEYSHSTVSEQVIYYGNMGCGVFKRGVQNWKDFCLRINIFKGNY